MAWDEEIKKSFQHCGQNVFIGQHCVFTNPSEVVLHDFVRIDPFSLITVSVEIGSYSQICSHVVMSGGAAHRVTFEGSNFVGYGSKIICASESYDGDGGPVGEYWYEGNKIARGDIFFKKFSGIASQVIIFPKVTLPEGCTIGEGSKVQSKDFLRPWAIHYGRPLGFVRVRKQVEGKLKDKWI